MSQYTRMKHAFRTILGYTDSEEKAPTAGMDDESLEKTFAGIEEKIQKAQAALEAYESDTRFVYTREELESAHKGVKDQRAKLHSRSKEPLSKLKDQLLEEQKNAKALIEKQAELLTKVEALPDEALGEEHVKEKQQLHQDITASQEGLQKASKSLDHCLEQVDSTMEKIDSSNEVLGKVEERLHKDLQGESQSKDTKGTFQRSPLSKLPDTTSSLVSSVNSSVSNICSTIGRGLEKVSSFVKDCFSKFTVFESQYQRLASLANFSRPSP